MFETSISEIYPFLAYTGLWFNYPEARFGTLIGALQSFRIIFTAAAWPLTVLDVVVTGLSESLAGGLFFAIAGSNIVNQIVYVFVWRKNFSRILDNFDDYLSARELTSGGEIFRRRIDFLWTLLRIYSTSCGFSAIVFFVVPFVFDLASSFFDSRQLPIRGMLLFGVVIPPETKRSLYYYSMTALSVWWVISITVGHIGFFGITCLVTSLVGTEIRCLSICVDMISVNNFETDWPNIIERHQKLLRLTRDVKEFFGYPLLYQNVVGGFIICLSLYNISTKFMVDWYIFFVSLSSLGLIVIFLFVVCYVGEYLKTAGEELFLAILKIPWYELRPKLRRELIMVIIQARNPIVIDYRGRSSLSLRTFMQIINAAYSYFMVLKSMN